MKIQFRPVYLAENQGHGNARRASLAHCTHELVALMDADDLSLPRRFERQLEVFAREADVSVVGGQITEFIGRPEHITGMRSVPERDEEIRAYLRKRCPMNQVSVMFKKSAVEAVGGYIDWFCEEDYYLWIRLAQAGKRFANVPEVLVNVRIGDEMSARRGGWKYFSSEARLQKYMLEQKIITLPEYLYNVLLRFGGEVLLPTRLRTKLFSLLRKEYVPPVLQEEEAQKPARAYPPFSVAMCVYGGDNADWFDAALESLLCQTVRPSEIVLVVDGPIPESIRQVIEKYERLCQT